MQNKHHSHARNACIGMLLLGASGAASALQINWVDWQRSTIDANGFTAFGTITTSTDSVDVTYNNPQGIAFFYTGASGEIDFWRQGGSGSLGRDPARSPYTSTGPNGVDNIPTGTDMIALRFAGNQTLSFSKAIANPYFSYISLNGNGYGFDQDFDILSFGDGTDNDIGYWGIGTSSKSTVGSEFQLLGTGEPHGTLRFTGAFSSVQWRSLSNENWNGFTIGIQGTQREVFPCEVDPTLPECDPNRVPEPSAAALMALGLLGAGYRLRARKSA
ncbi:MAG: PEP-CTERM sorting domain-containing protein [Gammaproteobacteria bacterium]